MVLEDLISKALSDLEKENVIEEILKERLKKLIEDAFNEAFSWNSEVRKLIEKRIEETVVPAIKDYDMSAYTTKLDIILSDIINNTTLEDNKHILDNFKHLMSEPVSETITIVELFDAYKDFVSHEIDTTGREVDFDGGRPEYVPVEVTVTIDHEEKRIWSSLDYIDVDFFISESEEESNQERLGFSLKLSRLGEGYGYKEKGFRITYNEDTSINSLKSLSKFQILLLRLSRAGVYLVPDDKVWKDLDSDVDYSDYVNTVDEPEATFE